MYPYWSVLHPFWVCIQIRDCRGTIRQIDNLDLEKVGYDKSEGISDRERESIICQEAHGDAEVIWRPCLFSSSTKEDSSPDSNLTLESDSSGVFLSLSNQSQEEAGSDSDQPISGSDLGSSSTSLEKDGDEGGGLKGWGREERAELQWCYPSLLDTSAHEDVGGDGGREEAVHGQTGRDGDRGKNESVRRVGKIGTVSIIRTQLDQTNIEGSRTLNTPHSEEAPPRKQVTLMGSDFPLPLSPSKQPIQHLLDPYQKPIRSSGLDCGDLDPFVQSDSFVYLAVSTRPASSQGEVASLTEVPSYGIKHDIAQHQSESMKTHLDQSNTEWTAKPTHPAPQKPEEGDFLCTDSFVYLAAPACLLLGPAGTTPYSGRYVYFVCVCVCVCVCVHCCSSAFHCSMFGEALEKVLENIQTSDVHVLNRGGENCHLGRGALRC